MIRLRAISLGAGVQSSTLALMAAHGDIGPMPDCAIFSDTHREPAVVYQWLDALEKLLPFPVHRVTAGDLGAIIGTERKRGRWRHMPLPAFVQGKEEVALLNRSCTRDFKIRPIRRFLRAQLRLTRRRSPAEAVVEQWIGISLDEVQRAKASPEPWIEHRWPLLELRMTRADCLRWLTDHGYPRPPKSSCTFCPYHDDAQWLAMKLGDPAAFAEAVDVDERIRNLRGGGVPIYLHRSLKPLAEVEFRPAPAGFDLFDEYGEAVECEGMCGL